MPVSFVSKALPDLVDAIWRKVTVVLTLALLNLVASVWVMPFIESIEVIIRFYKKINII